MPDRQVYVHGVLAAARQTVLHGAVKHAARSILPGTLSGEMHEFAPAEGLALLHGTGVRDEMVFAVPSILTVAPQTLGYYRLLLGVSQKGFYTTETGLRLFLPMEERGVTSEPAEALLPDLCREMNVAMALLLSVLPPGSLDEDVAQLPLTTLGAQADGSWRNVIGRTATIGVYNSLKEVIVGRGHTFTDVGSALTVTNAAGREVSIALAPDPDVEIREIINGREVLKVAIEIKGGTDYSNIHNRAGEAEKSHQKARNRGANQFWTVIAKDRADMARLAEESPTTNLWFDLEQVLARSGNDWTRLVDEVCVAMGI